MNRLALTEQARTQYLEAMGVDSYVPRWHLTNAAQSQHCELAVEVTTNPVTRNPTTKNPITRTANNTVPEDVQSDTQGSAQNAAQNTHLSKEQVTSLSEGLSSVLAELSDSNTKTRRSSPRPADEKKSEQNTSSQESIQSISDIQSQLAPASFNLGLWFTDTQIQILDSRQKGDALPTEALLSNMLLANGLMQTRLPPMETQVWPFPGALESERGWDAAHGMMVDFFQFRFKQSPARAILAFGEEAAKATLGPSINYEELCFSSKGTKHKDTPVIVLPALRTFLYEPALKSRVWSALELLRSAI